MATRQAEHYFGGALCRQRQQLKLSGIERHWLTTDESINSK
jgi:hypothetical protein